MLYIKGRQLISALCIAVFIVLGIWANNSKNNMVTVYLRDETEIDSFCANKIISLSNTCDSVKNKDLANVEVVFTTSFGDDPSNSDEYTKYCVGYSGIAMVFSDGDLVDTFETLDKWEHNNNYSYTASFGDFLIKVIDGDASICTNTNGKNLEIYIPNSDTVEYDIVVGNFRKLLAKELGYTNEYSDEVEAKLSALLNKCEYVGTYDRAKELREKEFTVIILPDYVSNAYYGLRNEYIVDGYSEYTILIFANIKALKDDVDLDSIYSKVLNNYNKDKLIRDDVEIDLIDMSYWTSYESFNSSNKLDKPKEISEQSYNTGG